ncbi:MAG: hypothetical protein U0414_07345 [Polyangiaceae bacterium]
MSGSERPAWVGKMGAIMNATGRSNLLAAAGVTEEELARRGIAEASVGELRRRFLRETSAEGCRIEVPEPPTDERKHQGPAPAPRVSFDVLARPVRGVRPLWSDVDLYGAFSVIAELAPHLVVDALLLCGETPDVLPDLRAEWARRAREPEVGAALTVRRAEHSVVTKRAIRGAKLELPESVDPHAAEGSSGG